MRLAGDIAIVREMINMYSVDLFGKPQDKRRNLA
jgi:hypothetical protein